MAQVGFYGFCNGKKYAAALPGAFCELFDLSADIQSRGAFRQVKIKICNRSDSPLVFNRAFVRVTLPSGPYEYFAQYNRWSNEGNGCWTPLDGKGVLLSHVHGRTTEGSTPFCALRRLGRKEGIAFHVLPLGNWRIRILPIVKSNAEPLVAVDLGMSDEELAFVLAPGESWMLPEVLIQDFSDFDESMAQLHRFLLDDPQISRRKLPVLFNTWFDRFDRLDISHLRDALAAAKEVGCEIFVVDAGWFGAEIPGWFECIGDWREKTQIAFRGNMKAFAEEVCSAGMKFGIWMEPERLYPDVPAVKAHPEWFIFIPETGCMRFDLDNPAAAAYFESEIERLIVDYRLAYMKLDMNTELGSDTTGRELYNYQCKFYSILDAVRARHPDIILENCASGALRTDLETLRHFDAIFPSDNVNPVAMFDILHELWRRALPGRIIRWVALCEFKQGIPFFEGARKGIVTPKEATWEEYEYVDLESLLIANFTGGLYGITGDIASLDTESRSLVAKYIALFKRKRDFLANAAGHWLEDGEKFKVVELEHGGNAIIECFYHPSDAVPERVVFPVGLDPSAAYSIDEHLCSGAELMKNGLSVRLEQDMHLKWRAKMILLEKSG